MCYHTFCLTDEEKSEQHYHRITLKLTGWVTIDATAELKSWARASSGDCGGCRLGLGRGVVTSLTEVDGGSCLGGGGGSGGMESSDVCELSFRNGEKYGNTALHTNSDTGEN